MEFLFIPLTALLASLLTFYAGFGLGTLLTPVMMLFFPAPTAIALTAIVHFLNNIFKAGLTWRYLDISLLIRFGTPAFLGALAGSHLLLQLSSQDAFALFTVAGKTLAVSILDTLIGLVLIAFAFFEAASLKPLKLYPKVSTYVGGVLSGFFGGFSGHQGALRSFFLQKMTPDKNTFIATGIALSLIVDVTRLISYANGVRAGAFTGQINLILLTVFAAFAGAWAGNRYLKKVTMETVQFVIKWGIIAIGLRVLFGSVRAV
jgi:uncharacterized membrane protein YfcA